MSDGKDEPQASHAVESDGHDRENAADGDAPADEAGNPSSGGAGPREDETAAIDAGVSGRRVTRRTVRRNVTSEVVEETVNEDIPLLAYLAERDLHPAPVG